MSMRGLSIFQCFQLSLQCLKLLVEEACYLHVEFRVFFFSWSCCEGDVFFWFHSQQVEKDYWVLHVCHVSYYLTEHPSNLRDLVASLGSFKYRNTLPTNQDPLTYSFPACTPFSLSFELLFWDRKHMLNKSKRVGTPYCFRF